MCVVEGSVMTSNDVLFTAMWILNSSSAVAMIRGSRDIDPVVCCC